MAHRSDSLSPTEQYLVEVVTDVAARDLGEDWGPWRRRDAQDDSGLRVDLTFDASNIALELTALHDADWNAAGSEAAKLEKELSAFVRERGLPGWIVGVSSTTRLKELATALKPLMAANIEIRPMHYSSQDLKEAEEAGALDEFVERHRKFRDLGLSVLHRTGDDAPVSFMIAGAGFQILGFTEHLAKAVVDNAAKLGEARPRDTHLAVLVVRWDLSDSPAETAPPSLPPGVDALWIVHPIRSQPDAQVWLAGRGDETWRLITSSRAGRST
jgi:hypothetical protein